jgi:hypothetical protein
LAVIGDDINLIAGTRFADHTVDRRIKNPRMARKKRSRPARLQDDRAKSGRRACQ